MTGIARLLHAAAAGALSAGAAGATGQDAADETGGMPTSPPAEPAAQEDSISVAVDLTVTNSYYFRGIIQEDEGVITQPSATVTADMEGVTGLPFVLYAGIWNSFHDRGTGASDPDDFVSRWYEFDAFAGLETTIERWTLGGGYTLYSSPNGAFGSVDEFFFSAAFDDSDLLPVALSPSAVIALEFGENGADGGSGQGVFLGLGVEPGIDLIEDGPHPVSLSLPLEAGFSLDDYYEGPSGDDDFFGYFRVGANATVGLPVRDGYGDWSLNGGVSLLVLGDSTSDINSGDETDVQIFIGLSGEV
ncbi:MAG: hypothetical protein AAF937_03250 [Planctomycetota bacterium]